MKKINFCTNKLLFIIIVILIIFAFTTCEGPMGPEGPQGPKGSGGIEVWDSSIPPQKLGLFITDFIPGISFYIFTSNNCLIHFNFLTGLPVNYLIRFTEENQTGEPMMISSNSTLFNKLFYNPHSEGTWYSFIENAHLFPITGHTSYYNIDGEPINGGSSFGENYKLRISSHS